MEQGRTVKGTVLTQDGKPIAGVMVEACFDDTHERKAVVSGANGQFTLEGLPNGKCTLIAHALELEQKIKHTLSLTKDDEGVQMRLLPNTSDTGQTVSSHLRHGTC